MRLHTCRFRGLLITVGLFVVSLAATVILDNRDLAWTSRFFTEGGANGGWTLGRSFPWGQLYQYGEIPPLIFAFCALATYAASRFGKAGPKYARPCLVVILTVVIGPGILVNGLLKECWGRPRPVDITAYGGNRDYRTVWQPAGPGGGKSFTCGHCAMAFSVASGAAFYRLHPVLAVSSVVVGVSYGLLMGVTRMVQGGHFPTDVLWSGTIVFMVMTVLYYFVLRVPERTGSEPPTEKRSGS